MQGKIFAGLALGVSLVGFGCASEEPGRRGVLTNPVTTGTDAGATPVVETPAPTPVVDAARPPAPKPDPVVPKDAGVPRPAPSTDAMVPPVVMTGSKDPRVPAKPAACPQIKTGTITVLGQRVELQVGTKQAGKKGPIMFYWHGTGGQPSEVNGGLGNGKAEILAEGGVIASFSTSTGKGNDTGNAVWYTGDFEMADQILACAIEQQDVDPRRVYTAGCSAGGLQASVMAYSRSSYLAASMPNSGGLAGWPGLNVLEDPSHVPATITTHGGASDWVVITFSESTADFNKDMASKGGFVVNCDHGGGHCGSSAAVKNAQWQFLKDHPFGVTPEPYAGGVPSGFPQFCKIIAK